MSALIRPDCFQYTLADLEALKECDTKLAALIDRYGLIEREANRDLFSSLVSTIISQQISRKAADTVKRRITELCGVVTPQAIDALDPAQIQQCGLSLRKVNYIKAACEAVISGFLDLDRLSVLSDEEIIRELSSLPGIGVWSAEMLLIFTLERMDIISFGDLGIRRGICALYDLDSLSRDQFTVYKARYSPYGSIASLYIWKLAAE